MSAGISIQCTLDFVQICLPSLNQFGSSNVPPVTARWPGLRSAVGPMLLPHFGQNLSLNQRPLSSDFDSNTDGAMPVN